MTRSTLAHVLYTIMLGVIVTALCCYAFYNFRMTAQKDKAINDAMKVIKAATEIVSMVAEKGMPSLRTKIEEIDQKNRQLEKRIVSAFQNPSFATIGSTFSQGQNQSSSNIGSPASGGSGFTSTATATIDEAALLAARRAARSASS